MKISTKLKELRKAKDLSQQIFADYIGETKTQVGHWETNRSNPTLEIIVVIAEKFEITTDWLLGIDNRSYEEAFGGKEVDSTLNKINDPTAITERLASMDQYLRSSLAVAESERLEMTISMKINNELLQELLLRTGGMTALQLKEKSDKIRVSYLMEFEKQNT